MKQIVDVIDIKGLVGFIEQTPRKNIINIISSLINFVKVYLSSYYTTSATINTLYISKILANLTGLLYLRAMGQYQW